MLRLLRLFQAMNAALDAGSELPWAHPDLVELLQKMERPLRVRVNECGKDAQGSDCQVSCDWVLNVVFEEVPDPVGQGEMDARLERERRSLCELLERPYGCWKEWLDANRDLL